MTGKKRYAMVVDTKVCVACKACVLACKSENAIPEGHSRAWLVEEVRGRFPDLRAENRSERCNHCSNAPCVSACPTGASHYAEGGLVLVSREKCTGCKACMTSCPYDARYVHPEGYVDKCTFCAHRSDGDGSSCARVCPAEAIHLGDLNDPASAVSTLLGTRRHKVLRKEMGTGPNVYFLY